MRNNTKKSALLKQLLRFGIVGASAASVHFSTVLFLVQRYQFSPLHANFFGFICALGISYTGHRYWTFVKHYAPFDSNGDHQRTPCPTPHHAVFPRFLTVALISGLLYQGLYYLLLADMHLPYQLALCIVLGTVPGITFLLNKRWTFQ